MVIFPHKYLTFEWPAQHDDKQENMVSQTFAETTDDTPWLSE